MKRFFIVLLLLVFIQPQLAGAGDNWAGDVQMSVGNREINGDSDINTSFDAVIGFKSEDGLLFQGAAN